MDRSAKTIAALALASALALSAAYATANLFGPKVNASPPSGPDASPGAEVGTNMLENKTDDQASMLERGNAAMGFDQYKIMHHFMATSTGGQIMIVALDSSDKETIDQIKAHVLDIQQEFSQGNFTKPFFIHAQEVPGTRVMEEKKDLIEYSIEQLDSGAILVLTTRDSELLQAIQQFMEFQGSQHHGH